LEQKNGTQLQSVTAVLARVAKKNTTRAEGIYWRSFAEGEGLEIF